MQNNSSSSQNTSPDIRRINEPRMETGLIISEAFRVRMIITPEMKATFLQDPARFMARFFEQRGHLVNRFDITVTANERLRRIISASTTDVELNEVVVHVVQGGVMSAGTPPHLTLEASQYL